MMGLIFKAALKTPSSDGHPSSYSVPSLKATQFSIACVLRAVALVLCLWGTSPAWAQRVQFPTMLEAPAAPAPAVTSPTPWTSAAPPAFDPYAAPLAQAPATPAPFPPPPSYPAATPYSPYAPSPYA